MMQTDGMPINIWLLPLRVFYYQQQTKRRKKRKGGEKERDKKDINVYKRYNDDV